MAKTATSRVGILVECGRRGLEHILCLRICELLREQTGAAFQVDPVVPMDNKRNLIQNCGPVVGSLFASGCDRVVILWDERPAWPTAGECLCWHNDRRDILANLLQAQVIDRSVHLVCIEREFESWLLFDHQMLSDVLSTKAHRVRVDAQRNPDRMQNPKGTMTSLFRKHRGLRYVDVQHAADFARCLQSLKCLRHCASFCRFAQRITGQPF